MDRLSQEQIDAYQSDGVVLIRDAVGSAWLERLNALVEAIVDSPSQWASDSGERAGQGRSLDERYLWRENEEVREFVFDSGVANLVGQAMGTKTLRFYFDHWFVKEPGVNNETPWHQDAPYWPFTGRQIASVWLALSPRRSEHERPGAHQGIPQVEQNPTSRSASSRPIQRPTGSERQKRHPAMRSRYRQQPRRLRHLLRADEPRRWTDLLGVDGARRPAQPLHATTSGGVHALAG